MNKFANVLKRLGVAKGDAVAIFTPNLSEAIIAVLACFRIGALFNTVFSGLLGAVAARSARVLCSRRSSSPPTAAFRRGHVVPLKATVDEAVDGLS